MSQANYPSFQGIDVTYKSQADNKDIRDLLVKLVPKAKAQMVTFAQKFKGRTPQETCKNIFDYIKSKQRVLSGVVVSRVRIERGVIVAVPKHRDDMRREFRRVRAFCGRNGEASSCGQHQVER